MHAVARGRCTCGHADCPSPGKHPHVAWAAFERSAPGLEQLQEWWRRWPRANVGVVTGAVSGVVVLDVDPRNGGDVSLATIRQCWGALPTTPEVRTGGGGRHLWFGAPGLVVATRLVLPGLDVKGEGGVVLVPPSVHASGRRYEWVPYRSPEGVALGAAPAWMLDPERPDAPGEARLAVGDAAPSLRTTDEQEEFARRWAQVGVVLAHGDRQYLCPFHPDHHPSLHVDAEGCRWYCFGCRRGGGIGRLGELAGGPARPRPWDRLTGSLDIEPAVAVTLPGDQPVDVVGESRHQDALLELTGGRRHYAGVDVVTVAYLVPDPENPVDPDAIAVVIGARRVGWLRRSDARSRALVESARRRDGDATCIARIRGGWDRGGDDVGRFGVVLLFPPA
jgi:hypothetical protein